MSDRFIGVDVLYDDKEWGNIIDPTEWNDNFLEIESAFNTLVAELNSGVITDEDKQVFIATYDMTTSFDINSALQLGKLVAVIYSGNTHYLMRTVSATDHLFFNFTYNPTTKLVNMSIIECNNDEWSQSNVELPSTQSLTADFATKTYVNDAIANLPPILGATVSGQKLIFSENN